MADLAWAAGILDARGGFVAYPRKGRPGSFIPRLRLRAKKYDIPETLAGILGGTHASAGRRAQGAWEWQISGARPVWDALEELRPFLRWRAREAQMLSALCRHIIDARRPGFEDRALTEQEIEEREHLLTALRQSRIPSF